jgi:hypothetical protein
MSKAKGQAKGAPRKPKYDQSKILALWDKGKSIAEIAEAMKPISKVFVHRVLTTKFPDQYATGQKERAAARESAKKAVK